MQGNMRPAEDSVRADGEIELASVAMFETALGARRNPFAAPALRANWAIRPQAMLQVVSGCMLIWKKLQNLEGAHCALAHFALLATFVVVMVHVPRDLP
jgi:hypothetical protein